MVTDRATAQRCYPQRIPRVRFEVIVAAGQGALVGLLASSLLALGIIAVSGLDAPGPLAIVQLLGPNVGTLGGAVVGAGLGLARRRPPGDLYCRVRDTGGILLLVHCASEAEAGAVLARVGALGGRGGTLQRAA